MVYFFFGLLAGGITPQFTDKYFNKNHWNGQGTIQNQLLQFWKVYSSSLYSAAHQQIHVL